ncbi:YciI family protein [Paenibacillus glycanilyticus]|uniref:YciI family protein n=1 Tax=Paenibacillus glycanilyticus TaxID=126569 RepID=UPI003EBC9CB5
MKFLCLGYLNAERMDALPKETIAEVMSQCTPHLEELYGTDQVLIDAGLGTEARSLRRAGGKVKVLDGPFTETKEMIGSVFIIEAENMEEAVRVASLHPAVQVNDGEPFEWAIEIRPIHYFKGEG